MKIWGLVPKSFISELEEEYRMETFGDFDLNKKIFKKKNVSKTD